MKKGKLGILNLKYNVMMIFHTKREKQRLKKNIFSMNLSTRKKF